jgi:hypothetical protein
MTTPRGPLRSALLGSLVLLAVAGCSVLPEAAIDPTRYYVLSGPSAVVVPRAEGPVVYLRPVELARYLHARPVIVRRGDNEIEFRDFARWGEPLELGVARVIRDELIARGAARGVQVAGVRRETGGRDYTLTVRVLACEGGAGGEVIFRAVWELVASGPKPRVVGGGEFRATGLRWDGQTEGSLTAQLSVAVSALAGDVAAALKP